jgi:hypothetical protein
VHHEDIRIEKKRKGLILKMIYKPSATTTAGKELLIN